MFTEVERLKINKVKAMFTKLGRNGKLGLTNVMVHHIDTGDARSIKQRQYNLSYHMNKHLNNELDRMLELGVIEKSSSAWSSPILLVSKSNGEYRLCLDDRK